MRLRPLCPFVMLLMLLVLLAGVVGESRAAVIHVNNQTGNDVADGLAEAVGSQGSGPVRTLRRAAILAHRGDTIVLANTGVPYYDTLQLNGARHSGVTGVMFTVVGNGAELNGAVTVPLEAWQPQGGGLWKLNTYHKGFYQLILDGQALPEFHPTIPIEPLKSLPPGHWLAWQGVIYYHQQGETPPTDRAFAFAARDVGITLYEVEDVRIVNLVCRHFRLDGINAHDRCRNVVLENVHCCENGRAGVAVGGSSQVTLRNSTLTANRLYSLLITERAAVQVENCQLDAPPTVRE